MAVNDCDLCQKCWLFSPQLAVFESVHVNTAVIDVKVLCGFVASHKICIISGT